MRIMSNADNPETDNRAAARQRLGTQLRILRKDAGLGAERAAQRVGVAPGMVWVWEKGKHVPTPENIDALLDTYRASDTARDAVLALAETARGPHTAPSKSLRLPDRVQTRLSHERRATKIRAYCPTSIPPWVQTRGYARAVLATSPILPLHELDAWVEVWQSRADILSHPRPPRVSIVLGERTLDFVPGGPVDERCTMVEQVSHLADRATWPHVEVRILPDAIPIGSSHPFALITVAGVGLVVHRYTEWTDRAASDADELAVCNQQYEDLMARTLSAEQSLEFLAARAAVMCAEPP